jgi:hypothetical protein
VEWLFAQAIGTAASSLAMQVNRHILDDNMISFCKGQADIHFADQGMPVNEVKSAASPTPSGSLQGGAFYDRHQNTLFTPNNLFWARFNRLRAGGAGVLSMKRHAYVHVKSLSIRACTDAECIACEACLVLKSMAVLKAKGAHATRPHSGLLCV